MSDRQLIARMKRLKRLYYFWKRLALTALALLVIGLLIGGGLIVRAYSSATEAWESAKREREMLALTIALERFRRSAHVGGRPVLLNFPQEVTRGEGKHKKQE